MDLGLYPGLTIELELDRFGWPQVDWKMENDGGSQMGYTMCVRDLDKLNLAIIVLF